MKATLLNRFRHLRAATDHLFCAVLGERATDAVIRARARALGPLHF